MSSIREAIDATPNTYFMVAADHPFECPCACCLRFLHEGLTSLAPEDRPSNIDFDEIVDCDDTPINRRELINIANRFL